MLEMKKSIGINSEYQSGCIFDFAIKKRAPRPDWCNVDRAIPNITTASVSDTTNFLSFFKVSHSDMAGKNSMNKEPM